MSKPHRLSLDIALLLPAAPDLKDPCVQRLLLTIKGQPGVEDAHIKEEPGEQAQLCIHHDPDQLPLGRLRELVQSAGASLTSRYGHLQASHATMHAREARLLAENLRAIDGVLQADVAPSGAVRLEFDRERLDEVNLRQQLSAFGVRPTADAPEAAPTQEPLRGGEPHAHPPHPGHSHDHAHGEEAGHQANTSGQDDHAGHSHDGLLGERAELVFSLICGALLIAGWLLERQGWPWSTALLIAAYGFGGFFTLREAIGNLRLRRFEIDTLMLVAAAGAAALGEWAEGALLLFLFSLGHALEHYALGRARRAIEALAKLAPERAVVRRDGKLVDLAVVELQPGDVVLVKPNERLPADGFVILGTSSINQAPVTGESVPVDKQPVTDVDAALAGFDRLAPEHRVFAGTINGSGALEIAVARRASESTMARVVRMVTEAQSQRSPAQNFTEAFERRFVPAVLGLVVLLLGACLVIDEPFSASFYRAMAVLVAASPCALAISVPSAVLSGVARAARSGVLIKGGAALENLGTLTAIAFDKTGTLTEGKPRLVDVSTADGVDESQLLRIAAAVELHSDHPLAAAVVTGARERLGETTPFPPVEALQSITGRGVSAQVEGELVHIGKAELFSEVAGEPLPAALLAQNESLVSGGRTTMLVRQGSRYLGVLGLMDTPRPEARGVMTELQSLGIQKLVMISGDNQRVAEAVAATVGLTEARGNLMPDDKVSAIQALRGREGKVAMVGDGVNDAPAMAHATVGIAMGAAGSDVALEAADVALMADDLAQLPLAVGLSRSSNRVIRQNLWVSLGVVAVLIPATLFGMNMGTAVLFHEGSTLLVVANALRLLAYQGKRA